MPSDARLRLQSLRDADDLLMKGVYFSLNRYRIFMNTKFNFTKFHQVLIYAR